MIESQGDRVAMSHSNGNIWRHNGMQEAISYCRWLVDLVFWVRNKVRVAFQATMPAALIQKASDNEQTFYVKIVESIVETDLIMKKYIYGIRPRHLLSPIKALLGF
jgi:hypothetical protein